MKQQIKEYIEALENAYDNATSNFRELERLTVHKKLLDAKGQLKKSGNPNIYFLKCRKCDAVATPISIEGLMSRSRQGCRNCKATWEYVENPFSDQDAL